MMNLDENKIKKQINSEVRFYQVKKTFKEKFFYIRLSITKQRPDCLFSLILKNVIYSFILLFLGVVLCDIDLENNSSYDQLLICVATAGPVVMGLYFTVLTFVASSTHENLPPKVQNIWLF